MIPVEYFWLMLVVVFGIIGTARGLAKELGSTTVLMLSLFTLYLGWDKIGTHIYAAIHGRAASLEATVVEAAYYSIAIVLISFISYEGVVLSFPVQGTKGLFKGVFGFLGGILNGYLVIGTVWDVVAHANYIKPGVWVTTHNLSSLHNTLIRYLPVTLMDRSSPVILLVVGVILLLAIVLK